MKKIYSVSILLAGLLISSVISVHGQTADLEGEWVNVDSRTRGLTRLTISRSAKGWNIAAWGKCHPKDCVWPSVVLTPLGRSVEDHSFEQGFAIWNPGFAAKYLTVTLSDGLLKAEMVTIFCDRSGRANFRSVEMLQRAEERLLGRQSRRRGESRSGIWNSNETEQ